MYKEQPKINSFIQQYGMNSLLKLGNILSDTGLRFQISDIRYNLKQGTYELTPELQKKLTKLEDSLITLKKNKAAGLLMIDLDTGELYPDHFTAWNLLIDRYLKNEKKSKA